MASLFAVGTGTVLAATPTVSGAFSSGAGISLDTTSAGGTNTSTALTGGVTFSGGAGDFNGGTLTITLPTGFEAFTPTVALDPGCAPMTQSASATGNTVSIALSGSNGSACNVGVTGLNVRPTNTVPTSGSITAAYGVTSLGSAGSIASVAGAATHIGFTQQPGGGTVNTAWAAQPWVAVLDQFNNVATQSSATISVFIATSTPTTGGPGSLSCPPGGNIAIPTVNGVAKFTGCQIDTAGTGYALTAYSSSGYGTATSSSFNITSAVGLNKLVFHQQPGSASVAGGPLSQQPIVWYVDASNTLINDNSLVVQLQVTPGTGTFSAVLTCNGVANPQVTVINGVANFSNCSVNLAGTGYSLTASPVPVLAGSPSSATSNPFNVGTGLADHLMFTQSPATTTSATLSPNPVVQVVSLGGIPVPSLSVVTLSLVAISGTGSLTCSGGNPSTTNGSTGSVTFTGCFVSGPGTYFLVASSPGLGTTTSNTFTVGSIVGGQVVFSTQPLGATLGVVPTAPSGSVWSVQPVVDLRTVGGILLTSDFSSIVSLSISSGSGGTLACTNGNSRTVSGGRATFSGCSITGASSNYQLRATVTYSGSPSLISIGTFADSLPFTITSANSLITFSTQPLGASSGYVPTGPAGTAFAIQPVVTLRNAAGAVLTSDFTSQVTLSITPTTPTAGGPGVLSCTGGNTKTVSAGVAAFTGCQINTAGTAYQLRAAVTLASSLITVNLFTDSFPFTITQSTTNISLTTYPSVVTWGDPFTATVQFASGGNHTFTLQRLAATDNGVWQIIPSASSTYTTDSSGRAVIQYTPRFNGQYKVVFNGDSTLGSGTSNIRTVNVRNLVLLRPQWTGTKSVHVGFTETYTATVRPVPSGGLPGGVARVEFMFFQLQGSSWVRVKSVVVGLNSSGVGTLRYTWNTAGQWYIRARTLANPYNFVGTSPLQRIDVQ